MKRAALAILLLASVLPACSNNAKSNAGGSAQPSGGATAAATPDCHGQTPVWTSERSKTYVLPGNRRYGKTEAGSYMCLSDAQSQGYHESRGRAHHRHRHHRRSALSQ